ncbi:hypothetical protein [Salinispora tropica]|uniref:Uncharacterized protein n=1 Tax=Salinispora tropica (strain ATCC BAA-916 / DSM 44818 / JCM 13857 / NBRC 105044 / CNB-440) TaxID=369723 RepID=A4X7Y2_SALTO|nr:hypothetical protein [Salinispora tropica]ABP54982.1 hypothetical protein Strop_2538 [Salinispora tropica CNB-440]
MADGPPAETPPPAVPPDPKQHPEAAPDAGRSGRWARPVRACRRGAARLAAVARRRAARLTPTARRLAARLTPATRRLWRWLLTVARTVDTAAKQGPAPPPPQDPIERREPAGPITVFARGYVFTFTIRADLTWRSQGLRPDQLAWYAHYFLPPVTQRLTGIAADLARSVAPHRAGELEAQLQRKLAQQEPWSFERGGQTVTCRPEAWVQLDERVRQTLQPYWERVIALDCRHEELLRRARYAEQLNRRWSAILADLPDADVPETVRDGLTRARERTLSEQRAAARWSGELLRQRHTGPEAETEPEPEVSG